MNEIVKIFLLAGDKFIPEIHLKLVQSIYKKQKKIEQFMQTGNTDFIYRNSCF